MKLHCNVLKMSLTQDEIDKDCDLIKVNSMKAKLAAKGEDTILYQYI